MNRIIKYLAYAAICIIGAASVVSCSKEKAKNLAGEWVLISIGDSSSDAAGVEVYLSFTKKGYFEIFQKSGNSSFVRYDGTFKMSKGKLSGTYSDGTPWRSTYKAEIRMSGEELSLSAEAGNEVCVYARTVIPSSVRASADLRSAGEPTEYRFL